MGLANSWSCKIDRTFMLLLTYACLDLEYTSKATALS